MKFVFLTLKKSQQNLRELIENLPDNINPFFHSCHIFNDVRKVKKGLQNDCLASHDTLTATILKLTRHIEIT